MREGAQVQAHHWAVSHISRTYGKCFLFAAEEGRMGSDPQPTFPLDTTDNTRSQTLAHPLTPDARGRVQHSPGPHWLWRWWFSSGFLLQSPACGCLWSVQNVSWKQSRQWCTAVLLLETSESPHFSLCVFWTQDFSYIRPARHRQIDPEKLFSEAFFKWFKGKVSIRHSLRTQALQWPYASQQCLDAGSLYNESSETRTSNPIWALQHSASSQSIPTHCLLQLQWFLTSCRDHIFIPNNASQELQTQRYKRKPTTDRSPVRAVSGSGFGQQQQPNWH